MNKHIIILLLAMAGFNYLYAQTAEKKSTEFTAASFPEADYTPFGYLDNPNHTYVFNRSGAIKSVPPLGYGFWCRRMPWPYGDGTSPNKNYLSLMHLSINQDGVVFDTATDFTKNNVRLISKYHSKNIMSYDWIFKDLVYELKYYHPAEHVILCDVTIKNTGSVNKAITLHATNIYGYQERRSWGSDGVASLYNQSADAGISKVWADGDVFAIGSTAKADAYKATASFEEWKSWISGNSLMNNTGAFSRYPDPVYTVRSYTVNVSPGNTTTLTLALTRGKNEPATVKDHVSYLKNAKSLLAEKINEDNEFYSGMPLLSGDWPKEWKRGWIYDYETLRMTIKKPVGIYKHHWDGMQIFSPRAVLGETALDAMCLSYADIELAKDLMLGVFADGVSPNIPCSREDGSMNMIGSDGRECGTAPIWGMPFHVISSIYERDRDDKWLNEVYPYLKDYINWWIENRTDEEGWFHAANSWESGQDGSKRFLIGAHEEGAPADYVRTVDIEAAMAHAMLMMQNFAKITNRNEDVNHWSALAEKRIKSTRSMFIDGWFRDVDARNNQPIILKDYYDIMMFLPASLKIASDDQMKDLIPMFHHFRKEPGHFMEWPSFLWPFTEAAWNAGLNIFNAEEVAKVGNRMYPRLDKRTVQPMRSSENIMPREYNFRIPGVSTEFWPINEDNPGGCENYGWGATLPTLIIRNIIGFREFADGQTGFYLSPALPSNVAQQGKTFGIDNLNYRGTRININYELEKNNKISANLLFSALSGKTVKVLNAKKQVVKKSTTPDISFSVKNGEVYSVVIE